MSELAEIAEEEAAELAYGLLWHMWIDRYTRNGRLASDARIAIGNAIGPDRKRMGLKRAHDFIAAHDIPPEAPRGKEKTMQGSNSLELNTATMIEAVQAWIDTQFAEGKAPKVKYVKPSNEHGCAGTFRVELESPAD